MSDPAKADRERRKLLDDETLVLCVGCDEAKPCDDEHVCDDCRGSATYRVCYGYMQQTTVPCDSFADALAVYREHHKDDPSGAQVYNDDRADGESNGLSEDELDALDEVHWPRPTGESDR